MVEIAYRKEDLQEELMHSVKCTDCNDSEYDCGDEIELYTYMYDDETEEDVPLCPLCAEFRDDEGR